MSAFLTITMSSMQTTIEALNDRPSIVGTVGRESAQVRLHMVYNID
jgi:hypothetical protein